MTLIFAFNSDVGSGSRQHCLLGHVCNQSSYDCGMSLAPIAASKRA